MYMYLNRINFHVIYKNADFKDILHLSSVLSDKGCRLSKYG